MAKKAKTAKTANGAIVRVGDVVEFKYDMEQCSRILDIRDGRVLVTAEVLDYDDEDNDWAEEVEMWVDAARVYKC